MALISSRTIITSLSLFHITLGFFFLTSPQTVADQALVYIVGESMGMPHPRGFDAPSGPLAFLAVVLAVMGCSDLVSLSLPEEICLFHHWGTQAPLRLIFSFCLVFYSFAFSSSSPMYGGSSSRHASAHSHGASYKPSSWGGDGLKNRIFFTFVFVEMISWFWVYVTLREEQTQLAQRKARRRASHSQRD